MQNSHDAMQRRDWYQKAVDYWKNIESTNNGMLGGYEEVDTADVQQSTTFLFEAVQKYPIGFDHCCDCGAGIGRVTRNFLSKFFKKVDLVEQNPGFLEQAKKGDFAEKVDQFICSGLQDFTPSSAKYDLIWCQWVLLYLTDEHLVQFLQRCKQGLKPNGLIGIKENICKQGQPIQFDEQDSSVTRPDQLYQDLFKKAGFTIIKEEFQKGFPDRLNFPVKM